MHELGVLCQIVKKVSNIAVEKFPVLKNVVLKILRVPGRGLVIKDIGY